MTVEEQRAADYRVEQISRAAATAARITGLHGDASARAALQVKWSPVLLASGPLVPIARGMFTVQPDLDYREDEMDCLPVLEQLA